MNGGKYIYGMELLTNGGIKNYIDLAVLILTVEAAPKNQYFKETFSIFSSNLTKYFREHNINELYISGNNEGLVSELLTFK